MKKFFALAIVVVALASCKKDYTCTCKVSNNVDNTETTTPTEFSGLSKSEAEDAKASCESANGTVEVLGVSVTTACNWSEN
jgi:hypothetical protein